MFDESADPGLEGGPVIFTAGHGTASVEDLIALLEEAGVRRLVDIRTAPGSRRHPQFGKDALARALQGRGIDYVWRKDLGGWRKPRSDSPHVALRSAPFRGYADHMETAEFDAAVDWLSESSRRSVTAMMCAESVWWRCHRRMVADVLQVRGSSVEHLLPGGRHQAHLIHPSARVTGRGIVYDVNGPSVRTVRNRGS
jgi:uncharacterized protein (DUF488 family)